MFRYLVLELADETVPLFFLQGIVQAGNSEAKKAF
jgi:hypothetical protein